MKREMVERKNSWEEEKHSCMAFYGCYNIEELRWVAFYRAGLHNSEVVADYQKDNTISTRFHTPSHLPKYRQSSI